MGKVKKPKPGRNKNDALTHNSDEEQVSAESKDSAIQTVLDQVQVRINKYL